MRVHFSLLLVLSCYSIISTFAFQHSLTFKAPEQTQTISQTISVGQVQVPVPQSPDQSNAGVNPAVINTPASAASAGNTKITIHIATDGVQPQPKAPSSPPQPPGSTFKPFAATALGGSDNLQVFQAAPLLNAPGVNGLGGGVNGVTDLNGVSVYNAAPLLGSSSSGGVNSMPIQTETNVRILGEECGSNPCAAEKPNPAKLAEQKLDVIKQAIAEQSAQIQSNNDWIAKVNALINQYVKRMGLVKEHAAAARTDLHNWFAKKRRFEAILTRLRAKEQLAVDAQKSNGEVYSPISEGYRCPTQTNC